MPVQRRLRMVAAALVCGLLGAAMAETAVPGTDAAKALLSHLAALKDTSTLQAKFVCEKRLTALETPLVSHGQVLIRRGDPREGDGAVRFTTTQPYVSDLILIKGKVLARSQHETEWTKTNQSSRPGLTAVMGQLGGWSTGDADKVLEYYSVKSGAGELPRQPAGKTEPPAVDLYTLTPTNKDLLKAVKQITLAIDRKEHHLLFIEVLTQQDDVTRYWFYDVKNNAELPADVFSPMAAPAKAPASDKP